MTLRLLQIVETKAKPQRAKLQMGRVYCHKCNGFGESEQDVDRRGCHTCDGTGVLKRERFGVANGFRRTWPRMKRSVASMAGPWIGPK